MFDFFRRHTRVLQFLLVLLIFPAFVLVGVQGYSSFTGTENRTVAKVAGQAITQGEWDMAMREQLDRAQRQMPGLDPKVFDSPEMKRLSLEALVRERVMRVAADRLHLVTTDERLQRVFASDPQFAEIRKDNGAVDADALAARGMSSESFAQRLRQDLSQRQVLVGIAGTVLAPPEVVAAAMDAMFQQREVQIERYQTKDFLAKVNPSEADVESYYQDPAHAAEFRAPEQAAIEYLVFDLEALKKEVKVSEEDLRKYYTENERRYTTPEERRASHILVKAERGMPEAERQKAKAKAEALLADVRKNPPALPELARKNSDDPGSGEKGGDLGFFGRGAMVKPFEDTAFTLRKGEVSGLVETDFGYHIIQVTDVRGGDKRSFETVRGELESEIRTQLAQKRFSELAVEFTNTVYEQPDSLKPAADRFKLDIRTAGDVKRAPAANPPGPLASPKLLDALFSPDAIANKRNTDAIEVAPNQLVSARIVKHEPAHQLPLAEVRPRVRERVATEQAAALAKKTGAERLAALQAAPATALGATPLLVSRAQPRELSGELLEAVLKAPAAPLPTLVGVDLGAQGYALARVNKVLGRDPVTADAARAQAQYAQTLAEAEAQSYYAGLKARYNVEISAGGDGAGETAPATPAR